MIFPFVAFPSPSLPFVVQYAVPWNPSIVLAAISYESVESNYLLSG